jgi:anti-anti-sigma factor
VDEAKRDTDALGDIRNIARFLTKGVPSKVPVSNRRTGCTVRHEAPTAMTDAMTLPSPLHPETPVFELGGEIDLLNADAIGDALCGGLDRHHTPIVVDLTEVTFIDSSAISMMLRVHKYAEYLHFSVSWRGARARAAEALSITGVDQILHVEHST